MKIEKVFVEFGGDPSNDKECYKRYTSTEPFEAVGHDREVIEFVSKEKYEKDLKSRCGYIILADSEDFNTPLCHYHFSEYENLQSKHSSLLEQCEKLVGASEFYGNPESWIERDLKNELVRYNIIHDTELIEKYQHPQTDWVGSVVVLGRKARLALKEFRGGE